MTVLMQYPRPESLPMTKLVWSSSPTSSGRMISYVSAFFSMPSWWMPGAGMDTGAPVTAVLGQQWRSPLGNLGITVPWILGLQTHDQCSFRKTMMRTLKTSDLEATSLEWQTMRKGTFYNDKQQQIVSLSITDHPLQGTLKYGTHRFRGRRRWHLQWLCWAESRHPATYSRYVSILQFCQKWEAAIRRLYGWKTLLEVYLG